MKLKNGAMLGVALMMAGGLAQAQDTIRIGVIAALTGPFANTGKPVRGRHQDLYATVRRQGRGQED
jgi:ABC-type branched-subunit amino acid transport system substrate-binding protein